MRAEPGYQRTTVAAAGRWHLRASHADREQMVDTLKAAFVQGRLTKNEFDARIAQTLAARTYGELATVTAGRAAAQPPRRRGSNAARWGTSGLVMPAILAAAFALGSLPGGSGYRAMALVVAFAYFVFWLSAGTDMLWQWYSMALPASRMCVRCAHTAASHRAPASCTVRWGSPTWWRHCSCAGYVPPGLSPEAVDRHVVPAR